MTGKAQLQGRLAQQAELFMARALQLARRARGRTWPNPMVGAVVVRSGKIVGEGYHHKAGLAHAEIEALRDAGPKAKGADLYVTLEPCHRFGRTPPCTDAIRKSGIRRVFVGTMDPNPEESGKGLDVLRSNGHVVYEGVLESRCRELNEVYNVFIRHHRPFVTIKAAISLDGRLAPYSRDSRWISSKESRKRAHALRSRAQGVVVGVGTALQDDPSLDVRHVSGKNPAAIVLDSHLSMSVKSKLVHLDRGAPVVVFCSGKAPSRKAKLLRTMGVEVVRVRSKNNLLNLDEVLSKLLELGIHDLLVEGGSRLLGSFMEGRFVDRVELFQAPIFLGSGGLPFADWRGPAKVSGAPCLRDVKRVRLGPDENIRGRLVWPS